MILLSTILTILHVLFALGIITTVLLQSGRSAGLSGAISGGAEQLFGKRKGMDELLSRISTGFAIAFMLTAIILTVVNG
ncbi:MAG: preprotein translocase subunit SecG [Bacillota bacterium]|jgi:preprotein translocase subunit SecG